MLLRHVALVVFANADLIFAEWEQQPVFTEEQYQPEYIAQQQPGYAEVQQRAYSEEPRSDRYTEEEQPAYTGELQYDKYTEEQQPVYSEGAQPARYTKEQKLDQYMEEYQPGYAEDQQRAYSEEPRPDRYSEEEQLAYTGEPQHDQYIEEQKFVYSEGSQADQYIEEQHFADAEEQKPDQYNEELTLDQYMEDYQPGYAEDQQLAYSEEPRPDRYSEEDHPAYTGEPQYDQYTEEQQHVYSEGSQPDQYIDEQQLAYVEEQKPNQYSEEQKLDQYMEEYQPGYVEDQQRAYSEEPRPDRYSEEESSLDSWWHKATAFQTIAITEMPLKDLYAYLDILEKYGTKVLGLNVAYFNGPLAMWGGLAMNDPFKVNKAFGSENEFDKFIAKAHSKGMRVISWMNPSYWWTGSKYFKQAEADMKSLKEGADWKTALPKNSTARWFQWSKQKSSKWKPADEDASANYPGEVLNWVWDQDVSYSYRAHWADQPMVDFNSPEFQIEWKKILSYWINERHLDGFVYDAPDRYLGVEEGALEHRFYEEQGIPSGQFKGVITDPARELSSEFGQFAEAYGNQHELVAFGLDAVLQSAWGDRFQAWGDIVEGIKAKDTSKIESAFEDYYKLLRTNQDNNYDGILWQRHHNLPFGSEDPRRNALARAISAAGGYLTAVEDPGVPSEWSAEGQWWDAEPYIGSEDMLQSLANALEACEAFAHGAQREPLAVQGNEDASVGAEGNSCDLNADADGSSCGDRIDWLVKSEGMSKPDAGAEVAHEFPSICGGCGSTTHILYAVLRYVDNGPVGFAIFNLEGSESVATIKVPALLQGQILSDCASNMDEKSLPLNETYTLKVPAYGFKMMSSTRQSGRKLLTTKQFGEGPEKASTAPTFVYV